MCNRAVLDYIGLPLNAPGALECRLRRVHYRDDGSVIDDGSRSGERQLGCHRLTLWPGDDIEAIVAQQAIPGYAPPDTSLIHLIAAHEWQPDVLAARREALRVNGPTLRLTVRAIGFDIVGAGELAIGFTRSIIGGPKDVQVLGKSSIKLLPGDPVELVLEAIRAHAVERDFRSPIDADLGLIRYVAAAIWTPERIERRQRAWLDWERTAPVPLAFGRAAELAGRLSRLAAPPSLQQPALQEARK